MQLYCKYNRLLCVIFPHPVFTVYSIQTNWAFTHILWNFEVKYRHRNLVLFGRRNTHKFMSENKLYYIRFLGRDILTSKIYETSRRNLPRT